MIAIMKRELNSYFSSPIGYVFLGAFYLFAGLFFVQGPLASATTDMRTLFASLFTIFVFIIPILTMRLLSEDKRQKTDQALLTAPVSLTAIVLGKYLAAVVVFLAAIAIIAVYAIVLAMFASPDWILLLGHFTGLILLGGALISIGMFVSSLTESQVISAVVSFLIMIFLVLIDSLASLVPIAFFADILNSLSFYSRYYTFTLGIFNFANAIFFLSVIAVFVFLTVRVLERRRWN